MALQKLNNSNFKNEVLEKEGIALVDFYATWCGPCKMISPVVDEIAAERADITVGKVDVDENGDLASAYGVMSIPTLIAFKDGKEYARSVGYKAKEQILAMLG